MFLFLLVIAVAQAKTVRYSNVPPRAAIATKTYDLEVPGSAPIRIIEAEPIWSPDVTTLVSHENEKRGIKQKTGKTYFTTQATQSTINEPVTHEPESSKEEALNSFLKDFAQKLKDDRKKNNSHNEEQSPEEPINKLASIYLENDRMDEDKLKSWGQIETKRHKHPYDDKKGWVTLEAVPWSTSKISKWQSNNKNEPKPWETNRPQSNWNTKYSNNPHKNQYLETYDNYNGSPNSFSNNFNDNDGFEDQSSSNDNIFIDKPVANYDVDIGPTNPERPQYLKPTYATDSRPIKIKPNLSDWPEELPSKPSWNLRPSSQNIPQNHWNNNNNNNPVLDLWPDRNPPILTYGSQGYKDDSRDIITDGRPGEFPKKIQNPFPTYEPIQERPIGSISNSHPVNHPSNGNGEWVLVSTTKGYQYPRNKHQRSIEVKSESIGTRRGIRLTVLPPSNDTNIKMTTSHGGLLEVESTFETVEESRKKQVASANVQRPNKTKKHIKKPVRSQVVITAKPKPVTSVSNTQKRPTINTVKRVNPVAASSNTQDATAVLAAVGAGMVPATMAMLVPFVTGRKKRNTENNLWQRINISDIPVYL